MKKNYIILLLSLTLTFSINAQNLILNPGFENHSLSDGCYTNESASNVSTYLSDINAFYGGTMDGIDIGVNSSCYSGGSNSGSTHIVMAGLSGPNMFESISFSLSTAIVSGNTYDLTFYASNSNPIGSESLKVGVSSNPNSFGTQASIIPLGSNGTYTQYSITFTAPENGDYLTIEPAALGGFWFGLDDFSLELNSVLSVIDVTNENVKLYPNPSNLGFIGVNGIKSMQDYIIYNSLGKETIIGKISENERIDIKNLTNGLYFLKFENRISLKFIKE